jgi:hypothetical protein
MRGEELGPIFEQCKKRKMAIPESTGGGMCWRSWAVCMRLTSSSNRTG